MFSKTRIALLCAGLLTAVVSVQAAEVEIWGVVDTSIVVADNGDETATKLSSGNRDPSRFGFTGSEQLSEDLQAFFRLEASVWVDTGAMAADNRLFDREAVLGVRSKTYGTLEMGRLYSPHFMTMVFGDPALMSLGSNLGNFGNPTYEGSINGYLADETTRGNNALQYTTPSMNGWTVELYGSLGESAGVEGIESKNKGNAYSVAVRYRGQRLAVHASWMHQNTINSRYAEWDDYYALGVNYDFDFTKPQVLVVHRQGSDTAYANTTTDAIGSPDLWALQVGTTTPIAGGALLTQVGMLKNDSRKDADAYAWTVRYDYPMSRRFTLYAGLTGVVNDDNANYAVSGGGSASTGLEVPYGNNTWVGFAGMTLKF